MPSGGAYVPGTHRKHGAGSGWRELGGDRAAPVVKRRSVKTGAKPGKD